MDKALEVLAAISPTNTPIGRCDLCGVSGPLKAVKVKRAKTFACIPCCIDKELS